MRIEFDETAERVTRYTIAPETPSEAVEANRVYGWFDPERQPLGFAAFITEPGAREVYIGKRSESQGAGFVIVEARLVEYLDPYVRRLQERTGHCLEDHEDTIDVMAALGALKHTRHLLEAVYHPGELRVRAIVAAHGDFEEDDNAGREAKAGHWLLNGLEDDIGQAYIEREFIQNRSGSYSHNPDYGRGRRKAATVTVGSEKVWAAIWRHWKWNYANAAQLATLARHSSFKGGPSDPTGNDYQGFHIDNYGQLVKWDDFACMKEAPPVKLPEEVAP